MIGRPPSNASLPCAIDCLFGDFSSCTYCRNLLAHQSTLPMLNFKIKYSKQGRADMRMAEVKSASAGHPLFFAAQQSIVLPEYQSKLPVIKC